MHKQSLATLALSVLLALCLASCGGQQQTSVSADPTDKTDELINLLAAGDFDGAVKIFDEPLQRAMTSQDLYNTWSSMTTQLGDFERQTGVRTSTEDGATVAYATCRFQRGKVDIKLVFSNTKQVTGIEFIPVS